MNAGSICTKCGHIHDPAPAPTSSMESNIVKALFRALACAQKRPGTFEVESRNENGMQGIAILAIDSNVFDKVLVPILTHLNLAPLDVSAQ
jgi:hypothetical protein